MSAQSAACGLAKPESRLFGRGAEIAMLERIVDRVPEHGDTLVVRGEPGVGKTSLLEVAKGRACSCGLRVLHATGVQSEADLAFSGLHQLLLPILDRREALPAGERDALGAAFGLLDVPVQDPFLIAQATLGLLADAAELTPLLLVCEDAQWLDRATASALLFVARRVGSEPIALLFAIRDGYPGPLDTAELPELRPARLDDQAARQLLDERRARLSPRCRQRVLRIADGNPLALIELPGEPASVGMGGWDPIADPVSLTVRLERAFMCRQAGLPEGTRAVLLVAAADGEVVRSELLAAASLIVCDQLDASALAPALAAGLVKADGARLAFRHPLIRSAIYQAAGNGERRAAHAALAAVLCDDPDRRTWHRAASSIGPDDHVASELEGLASRLARRGAISVAIAALERAAGLSSRPEHRAERLLAGAELGFEMGQASVVERLVGAAEQTGPNPRQRAQITWLREIFTDGIPGDPAPVLSLAAAGERCSSAGDTDLALKLLLGAGLRSWWRDPGEAVRARVVDVADAVPAAPHDPRLIAIIAVSAPMTRGSVTVERLSELDRRGLEDPQAAYLAGMAAHAVGHYELAARFFETSQSGLRAQGRLAVLCQVLTMAAWDQILLGDWVAAAASAEEGGRLARETGQPIWSAGAGIALALLAGVRGDGDRAEQLVTEAESVTIPRGLSAMRCVGALARGVTALGEGRHADALDHLSRMFDPADPAYHHADRFMGIGYLTDAAARCGQLDVARITLRELELLKEVTSSPALELGLVYARPILADDHEAEPLYRIGLSELHRWPFIRARLQLAYGAWLRRQRRVAASREPLRAAHETFGALGAVAWSERARQELVASGEEASPRRRDVEELTPQELQIAQMAATGLSNREIAQQLYLSPRTVATHLYRVFPKLAIRSRSELGGALGAGHK